MTGHVRQSNDLSSQYSILTGHCLLTSRYLHPWFSYTLTHLAAKTIFFQRVRGCTKYM